MKKILLFAISIISAISFANAQSVFQGKTTGTVTQNTTPYDYTLNYMFTWNATDGSITLNANFDWANDKPFGLEGWTHLYVTYDNIEHTFNGVTFDNGIINFTFSKEGGKFVEGETINVRFYWPGGAGVIVQPSVDYKVGSSSNDEPEIGIKIRETDIVTTSSSALIFYDPEYPGNVYFNDIDYTVSYKDEANGIEGTSKDNPIGINGLKADTQYNMVFTASGTINGQTYTSTPQTVTFWTLKEGEEPETAVTYSGSKRGTHEQTIEGVTTNYDYTLNCEITYNADKTLSFNSSFNWDNVNGPIGGTGNLK